MKPNRQKPPYLMIYDWQDALPDRCQPFAHVCFSGALSLVAAQQQGETQEGCQRLGGAPVLLQAAQALVADLIGLVLL